jgi:luciferase family oxidoreductase group 1
MASSIDATIELAGEADRLGYTRYWLTEHPPQPNPQLTIGLLAGVTDSIRVGTAGILLRYRNPIEAAQNFLMLEKLFPGRIDAGFCAGKAGSALLDAALLDGRRDECDDPLTFGERVDRFAGHLRGEQQAPQWPERAGAPQIWTFGGRASAELAARLGTAFGYSLFHANSRDDPAVVDLYRGQFRASEGLTEPRVALAVAGVCAATNERARALRAEHRNEYITPTIVGDPDECRAQLEALRERYRADDIAFLDICRRHDDRRRAYRLLAEACALPCRALVGAA